MKIRILNLNTKYSKSLFKNPVKLQMKRALIYRDRKLIIHV